MKLLPGLALLVQPQQRRVQVGRRHAGPQQLAGAALDPAPGHRAELDAVGRAATRAWRSRRRPRATEVSQASGRKISERLAHLGEQAQPGGVVGKRCGRRDSDLFERLVEHLARLAELAVGQLPGVLAAPGRPRAGSVIRAAYQGSASGGVPERPDRRGLAQRAAQLGDPVRVQRRRGPPPAAGPASAAPAAWRSARPGRPAAPYAETPQGSCRRCIASTWPASRSARSRAAASACRVGGLLGRAAVGPSAAPAAWSSADSVGSLAGSGGRPR